MIRKQEIFTNVKFTGMGNVDELGRINREDEVKGFAHQNF